MLDKKVAMKCCAAQHDNILDKAYWNAQWEAKKTGWDLGEVSPAIKAFMAQYNNLEAAILIPGCGNAHEAIYLVERGFTNITLIDISKSATNLLKEKFKNMPNVKIVCEDFFEHKGKYDLIIEQTFFCAISPSKRKEYAKKMADLLGSGGKIIGLLFNRNFTESGPPFGGSIVEYKPIFDPYFAIKIMDECYNSIKPRANTEVFINLVKIKR